MTERSALTEQVLKEGGICGGDGALPLMSLHCFVGL